MIRAYKVKMVNEQEYQMFLKSNMVKIIINIKKCSHVLKVSHLKSRDLFHCIVVDFIKVFKSNIKFRNIFPGLLFKPNDLIFTFKL